MATTPDRFPGTRLEEEIILDTNPTPIGGLGSVSFDGTSFWLVDAQGRFNPRPNFDDIIIDEQGRIVYVGDGLIVLRG